MSSRAHLVLAAICFLVATIRGAEATNLVANGGFESQAFMTTDPEGNQYRYVPDDLYPITGWTFGSTGHGENSYLIAAGLNYGTVPEGSYALRLNVGDSISQAIVPPGAGFYSVSIVTQGWQVGYNDLRLTIGGASVVIPIGTTGTTLLTAALSGSTTLAIDWLPVLGNEENAAAEDYHGSGVVVDAIGITAALPEPSSMALAAIGIAAAAGLAARRRKGRTSPVA